MMKTREEILSEIKATDRTLKNYRQAYKDGKIDRDTLKHYITDCTSTIDALRWVLGENDRYD